MKKRQIKALKDLSDKLPPSTTIIIYSVGKLGVELDEESIDQLVKQNEFDPEAIYRDKGHVKYEEINHFNRMKKAYARKKEQGIIDYIKWLDEHNQKLNDLLKETKLERVSADIMAVAEKGAQGFWKNLFNFFLALVAVFFPQKEETQELEPSL